MKNKRKRKEREEQQLKKDKERESRKKDKRERKLEDAKNKKYNNDNKNKKKENDKVYSLNKIANQNMNKKTNPFKGGDLFSSLDDIANKIKKEQNERNRIVYNTTNKNRY